MNSPDILLYAAVSHGHNCRIYLCLSLHLFTESYLVADAITYKSNPQCLSIALSVSTHQYQVNTTSSQISMLVPGFQEPLTAQHPRNKCFV